MRWPRSTDGHRRPVVCPLPSRTGDTKCTFDAAEPWAQRYFVAAMKEDREIVSRELFMRQGQSEELSLVLDTPLTEIGVGSVNG